ncbi:MAG: ABC transporter substrate-binding protein [Chlorobium sp.]|nr:MAG: ABC transporter substrate-binding protein [Chlorobium sp.]
MKSTIPLSLQRLKILKFSCLLVSFLFLFLSVAKAQTYPPLSPSVPVKVGYLPVTGHAKFFVAQEKGFFAQEGLTVELIQFANSADGISALRAKKIDIGAFGTTAPLVHVAKGADIRIIGGIMGEDAAIITTAEKALLIKTVKDLKGKKVATVRLASGDAVLRGALQRAGINWKKDLQIFELKNPPAVLEAVKSGQVDAGVVWGPHDVRAEEMGLKIITRSHELAPGHPCCRLAVNNDELKSEANVWPRFVRAILRAEKFTQSQVNRTETVAIIQQYLKIDPALIEKAYYGGHLDQSSDPNVKGVEAFWKTMQQSEFVESKGSIRPFIVTSVYKSALESLIAENPNDAYWAKLKKQFNARD